MTKEELKNQITELKENCKKLAEEYRERYNKDNDNKIALNMFYHNVISYNDYESVLALFENRNSMIMCFSAPPVLTEETVEINLKRVAELELEIKKHEWNDIFLEDCASYDKKIAEEYKTLQERIEELEQENAILEKALRLYVDWADECGIAWNNFPDMTEKWYKKVEEKELDWIDGLIFMVKEEAKEQLLSEVEK